MTIRDSGALHHVLAGLVVLLILAAMVAVAVVVA